MSVLGDLEAGLPAIGDEPIVAWRKWAIVNGDLAALNSTPWPYRAAFQAECAVEEQHEGSAPVSGCTCGIYAAKTLASLQGAGYGIGAKPHEAFGTVKLWGRVVCHKLGFRAQYAYPEHIWCADPIYADLIKRNYGCAVTLIEPPPAPLVVTQADAAPAAPMVVLPNGQVPMMSLTLRTPTGFAFNYNGAADYDAIGRWFAGFVPMLWRDLEAAAGMQWGWQMDARAWRQ